MKLFIYNSYALYYNTRAVVITIAAKQYSAAPGLLKPEGIPAGPRPICCVVLYFVLHRSQKNRLQARSIRRAGRKNPHKHGLFGARAHADYAKILPAVGLEPTRPLGQQNLSLPRLPFRHAGMRYETV